ncbi:MAG: (Fe-S)-binding protein [Planctomycetota bacterium]
MDRSQLQQLPTLKDCVHCGLCLPACPTYAITGKEVESPRGRIAALRLLAEGKSDVTPALAEGLDNCLICRSCESHCPSGISMEQLIAGYRADTPAKGWRAALERFALRRVVAAPRRMRMATALAAASAPILRHLPLARLGLPADLPRRDRLRTRKLPLPRRLDPAGDARGTVALLRGCITDIWFRDELLATARVLRHNGYVVHLVGPGCCGALHKHAGLAETAEQLGTTAAEQLLAVQPDWIAIESAGCAPVFAGEHAITGPLTQTADKAIDPFTLLVTEGWQPPRLRVSGDWVVAPPCHHQHGPFGEDGVRTVLEQTLTSGYRELPPPDHCCGAAGTYMVRNARQSRAIGDAARARFIASGGTGLVTGNPGCLLRWESLLPDSTPVLHPLAVLDRAYRDGGDYTDA